MVTGADVLRAIADDKSLVLFNTIALSNCNSDIFLATLGLTRKQYYSRLSAFQKSGIVKRRAGKYSLTTFGILLYHSQELIGKALKEYWKLKAIDSIHVSGLPEEQIFKIVDTLITNQEIKNIILEQIKEKFPIFEAQVPFVSLSKKEK